jgi:hypothetical protein
MALRLANHFTPSPRRREDGKSFALFAESFANLAVKVFKVLIRKERKERKSAKKQSWLRFSIPAPPGIRQRC